VSISIDISIQLVWAVANSEAFLAGDQRIRPVHFLLGILKVIDPAFTKQMAALDIPEEQKQRLIQTGAAARHYLEMSPDDITAFRRRLRKKTRAKAKQPSLQTPRTMLHRSEESRALFASLANRGTDSRNHEITVLSLLEELVRSKAVDLESLWQEVVKGKMPSVTTAPLKGSSNREGRLIRSDETKPSPEPELPPELDGHGRNLTQLAKSGHLHPVIGRKREITAVARFLHRANKRSVLLVGPSGVGKTSIVEALAQELCRPAAPAALLDTVMIQITAGELMLALAADGRDTHAIRHRLDGLKVIDGLVLAVEDVDRLLTPEAGCEAAAELLRNAILRGEISCVGTTTPHLYEVMKHSHCSFTQSFNCLQVVELSSAECLPVAEQWAGGVARFHGVRFADGAVAYAVELASEVLASGGLLAKALDLLENAAVFRKVAMLSSRANHCAPDDLVVTKEHILHVVHELHDRDGDRHKLS
jgi:ATP-dependent Clp protease ATP-binding subunit ClpA